MENQAETVYEEMEPKERVVNQKINTRSASHHFSMNNKEGSEIVSGKNKIKEVDLGSPYNTKTGRQTNTSVV